MEATHSVPVSPRHRVTVGDDYFALIERAPVQDFVVRALATRSAGGTPLMSGELVIAGYPTRQQYPLAKRFPLHFRKTYHLGQLRGDPAGEFARHEQASAVLGIPPPIGHARNVFRSCLLPGRPFDSITPFGSEPEESNVKHADDLSLASAAGLWRLAESILDSLTRLQQAGLAHGDAYLHNFVVCSSPLEVLPIDFDMAIERSSVSEDVWLQRCQQDLVPLLKLAVYLQCTLGAQPGPLGERSRACLDELFERSRPFRRAIESRAGLMTRL